METQWCLAVNTSGNILLGDANTSGNQPETTAIIDACRSQRKTLFGMFVFFSLCPWEGSVGGLFLFSVLFLDRRSSVMCQRLYSQDIWKCQGIMSYFSSSKSIASVILLLYSQGTQCRMKDRNPTIHFQRHFYCYCLLCLIIYLCLQQAHLIMGYLLLSTFTYFSTLSTCTIYNEWGEWGFG